MKKLTLIVTIVVLVGSLFGWWYIMSSTKSIKQVNPPTQNVDSLNLQIDSLRQEILVKDIELGRYEYVFDRMDEELNDDCKNKIGKILNETE